MLDMSRVKRAHRRKKVNCREIPSPTQKAAGLNSTAKMLGYYPFNISKY